MPISRKTSIDGGASPMAPSCFVDSSNTEFCDSVQVQFLALFQAIPQAAADASVDDRFVAKRRVSSASVPRINRASACVICRRT